MQNTSTDNPTASGPTANSPTANSPANLYSQSSQSELAHLGDTRAPRLFTKKGLLIAFGILVFAIAMTVGSIYVRRTPLEKTTAFFGPDVIKAIQLGEQLRIVIPPDSPMVNAEAPLAIIREDGSQTANLSGSPGLGHFRHALLNERHYQWDTIAQGPADKLGIENPEYVYVELEGRPTDARPLPVPIEIVPTRLVLELTQGWVSLDGGQQSVKVTQRVRTGLHNFIDTRKAIGDHPSM